MYISDFLSRHPGNDTSSPNEIIPIAFIIQKWSKVNKKMSAILITLISEIWSEYDKGTYFKCSEYENETELIALLEECKITTRGMKRKAGEKVPNIWPLTGNHKKPENSPTIPNVTTE